MPFMSAIDMLSFQVINDIDKDMIIIHTQDKIKDSVFQKKVKTSMLCFSVQLWKFVWVVGVGG